VLAVGIAGWIVIGGSNEAVTFPPNEIYMEPVGSVEFAFTTNLLTGSTTDEPPGPPTTLTAASAAEVALVKGSDEMNYAGSQGASGCDTQMLLDYLNGEPAVSAAWAEAQGIEPDQVSGFIGSLTSMLLTQDVRVTDYVLDNGRAVARQALLQRESAVLVTPNAEPRVRCVSGSPLTLPAAVATPTYVGVAWLGFNPSGVVEIEPCDEPLTQFVLFDISTGDAFVRTIGAGAASDVDSTVEAAATTQTTTTTTPLVTTTTAATTTTSTTSTTTTTLPVADYEATGEGTVTASSRLCGAYAATKAVDGDATTSWISSSGDGAVSTFQWTGTQDEFVGNVEIISNAANASRGTDHGFAAVTIQVLDASGTVVFEARVELPGTPDPDVVVYPNIVGRSVLLLLEGHENPSGSGFSELTVMVAR